MIRLGMGHIMLKVDYWELSSFVKTQKWKHMTLIKSVVTYGSETCT